MSDFEVIRVEGLTKAYTETVAVDGISFSVSKGEVVGFLGPNGAGKTTTLKMLTCFMPATAGTASINGYDISTQSIRVRRSIGYLPENNPLYEEMRVAEYLRFRAALKWVRWSQRRRNVDEALAQCGLTDVTHRTIGQLSKGYRQRVGLADTLVGDPPVLILDEPTAGLDPQQIVEVRELIKRLSEVKTILLSTHYLPEVEQTCDRVIVINRGRIVLDDTVEHLRSAEEGSRTMEEVFMEATHGKTMPAPAAAGTEEEEEEGENEHEQEEEEEAGDGDGGEGEEGKK
ncbi:MAG: ATP-binding cassette domain-containing protein [bacterium]